jgi:hypothetical protein
MLLDRGCRAGHCGAIQAFCQGASQGLLQARAELGRGVPDGGERAQHQEFALGQGEPGAGVEVTEVELGQEPRQHGLHGPTRGPNVGDPGYRYIR